MARSGQNSNYHYNLEYKYAMEDNFLYLLPLLILSMLVNVSCESRDGDWESMKWKTDAKMNKERIINVPVSGGTYVFTCKNYSRFWLSVVIEDNK